MTAPITDERALPYVYFHQVAPEDQIEDLNLWAAPKMADGVPPQFEKDESGNIVGWDGISYQTPVVVGIYLVVPGGGWAIQHMTKQDFENLYKPAGP